MVGLSGGCIGEVNGGTNAIYLIFLGFLRLFTVCFFVLVLVVALLNNTNAFFLFLGSLTIL